MFCSANLFIEEYIMTQRHFSKPMAHWGHLRFNLESC
jgi:hypothetical protein